MSAVGFYALVVKAPVQVCVAGCVSVLCVLCKLCVSTSWSSSSASLLAGFAKGGGSSTHQAGMGKTSGSVSTPDLALLGQEGGTHGVLNGTGFSYFLTKTADKGAREWDAGL